MLHAIELGGMTMTADLTARVNVAGLHPIDGSGPRPNVVVLLHVWCIGGVFFPLFEYQ